ncbi:SirB1 family protein [Synechocystis sp. PCC 7509]|uniref:SirB1 family protein n=1 Tax=Synechocystis sp. PCC 7509 TaxID=927677 RepID=UPI0002ACFA10|nr:SirB1 family protein [Synechocystis sp. PCC 7509]
MSYLRSRQYFQQEISQQDEEIDLALSALYIAQEEYSSLDVLKYLNTLDAMAAELKKRLPSQRYPLKNIQTINSYLYDDLKFSGNVTEYYDPRNSFLNDVIERRVGIPITLSLVYLEIAKRIDFPMVGVGMPGHFVIRPQLADMEIFVDPFNHGEVLFLEDCQERIMKVYGQPVVMQPEFFATISNRQFLARMLSNLKLIYLNSQQLEKALAAVERILMLFPSAIVEIRDRGLIYYQIGSWISAVKDFETYLQKVPDAQDAPVIRRLLKQLSSDS